MSREDARSATYYRHVRKCTRRHVCEKNGALECDDSVDDGHRPGCAPCVCPNILMNQRTLERHVPITAHHLAAQQMQSSLKKGSKNLGGLWVTTGIRFVTFCAGNNSALLGSRSDLKTLIEMIDLKHEKSHLTDQDVTMHTYNTSWTFCEIVLLDRPSFCFSLCNTVGKCTPTNSLVHE